MGSTVLVMIIFLTGLLSGIRQLHSFYTRFHNFDASDETLEAAISYIDNKDYSAAIPRLTYLLNSGWDGYTVYQELSSAYYSAGNDNASADTTCDFIINHYGTANCTNFTDAFRSLCEDTGGTTGNTAARVENILTECQKYAELYYQIEKELYSGQNKKALYDCELLKNSGAGCFYFACLYSTALVETDHIDDAYHYIISFVQDDSTYQAKSVTTDQRKLLLNYIKGYVRSEKRVICENYINYALDDLNLDLHSGLQYSSPDRLHAVLRCGCPDHKKEDVGGADPHPGAGIYLHRWHGCTDLIRKSAGGHAVLRSGHLGIILGGACPSDLRWTVLETENESRGGGSVLYGTYLLCPVLENGSPDILGISGNTVRGGSLCCDPDV